MTDYLFPNVKINSEAKSVKDIFIGECTMTKKDKVYIVSKEGESESYILKLYKKTEMFLTETRNLRALENFKKVPKIVYSNTNKGFLFNILTQLPGKDLFDYFVDNNITLEKKIPLLRKIGRKILLILQFLHKKNMLHGDIKPENILYDEKTEEVYLIDFDGRLTISFVSPQLVLNKGKTLDKKDDVWALGVTFYYLLMDRFPFESKIETVNKYVIMRPEWGSLFSDFLLCLLDKDQETRYSVDECLNHPWFLEYKDLK